MRPKYSFKQGHLANDSVERCHGDIHDFSSDVDIVKDKGFFSSILCIIYCFCKWGVFKYYVMNNIT